MLGGQILEFTLEYVCHSPTEQLWFRVMVSPLRRGAEMGAAVMHVNVTERRLAEEALRRSEGQQRQLAHQLAAEKSRLVAAQSVAMVGSWETDLVTRAVIWSDETYHTFGTEPSTFTPTHEAFLNLVHPDDRAAVRRAFEQSLVDKRTHKIEHRILLPDGGIKNVEERWRAVHDATGRPVRAIGTCRDITEHKRSQAERELMFNLSADLMSISHFGGPLEQVNPAWTKVLGWSTAELIGRPSLDFVLAEDREATFRARQDLVAGRPIRNLENRYRCKDGSYRWLSWNSEPLVETSQVFAVARDITGQKQADSRQQQAQAMSRMAGRLARIGSWQFDLPTQSLIWSDELRAIHETAPDYAPTIEEGINFYAPEARGELRGAFGACLSEGTPLDRELPVITAKGRRIWVRVIGEAVRDEAGAIVQVRGAFQDITERKQDEDEFRQIADRLTSTLESITDAFLMMNREWRFTFLNREAERLLARPHAELIGRNIWECFPGMVGSAFDREYQIALAENHSVAFEEFYAPLKAWFAVRVYPSENGLAVYFRDVTARVLSERELARTHRALQMLSRCNESLIRAESEDRLLHDICEIAVGIGGFRLAWVGYAMDDEAKSIVPRAHAGVEDGYLSAIHLSWAADRPSGTGPAARAIRTGIPVIVPDLTDPGAGFRYVKEATSRGYRGLICLPLRHGPRAFGVLALYLDGVRTVPADELALLEELAADLAFGIGNLRAHLDRRRTHETVLALARGISASTGDEFFEKLTHGMIEALGAHGGAIIRFDTPGGSSWQTLCAVHANLPAPHLAHGLPARPVGIFPDTEPWIVAQDAQKLHPEFPHLAETATEAWVTARMMNTAHQAIGELFVLFPKPLEQPKFIASILQIFAARAAAELERQTVDVKTREQAALLDKAQDAILVCDLEHRITFWNKSAERLYGWTAEEATGRTTRELLYPDPGIFDAAMQKLLTAGEWSGEVVHLTKDGRKLDIEGRWTLVRDDQGHPKSVLAINTDLTERKRLEHQFLRAQRMESIGTLAGGIAHDLNNLLAPISMGVGLLKLHGTSPKSLKVIENIERSAQRGAELVKQVLSFARGVDGTRVPLQARHIIREVEDIIENTFPKNITIEVSVPTELPLVLADPTQLNQVLLNLCVNARDAMLAGGRLTLTARSEVIDRQLAAMDPGAAPGTYVRVEVTDTGSGIPPEIIDRIFEPFFTTKEIGKGTGLGLSTVIGIIRSHGGFVNVRSEPGQGSTFTIHLPAQTEGATTTAAPAAAEKLPRGNGELILLVDDEVPILQITQETLESFGYRVVTAQDGAHAIGLYAMQHQEISAVLTDMMMPIMDGPALIIALQRINPAVRIIAASGFTAKGHAERLISTGVKNFLPKPYTAETMLTVIGNVLSAGTPSPAAAAPQRPTV